MSTLLLACVLVAVLGLVAVFVSGVGLPSSYQAHVEKQCDEEGCAKSFFTFCGCSKMNEQRKPWYGFFAP